MSFICGAWCRTTDGGVARCDKSITWQAGETQRHHADMNERHVDSVIAYGFTDHDCHPDRVQHYKGGTYDVLSRYAHIEATGDRVVVYRSTDPFAPIDKSVWVRPFDEFVGQVDVTKDYDTNSFFVPRFKSIS